MPGCVEQTQGSDPRDHDTDEPIVILDQDDPLLLSADAVTSDVLTRVMQNAIAAFGTASAAHEYLRSVGLPDAMVWSDFRLGVGDPSLADGLTKADLAALADIGLVHGLHQTLTIAKPGCILLPTVDPREPERVVGVIRLKPAHHHH
ncbi:MAG: hypothetical protein H0W83_17525, partial [Planctomycetes bacterium]|nr:hypothetical protein [Planctomycetota bacterium]